MWGFLDIEGHMGSDHRQVQLWGFLNTRVQVRSHGVRAWTSHDVGFSGCQGTHGVT